MSIPKIIFGVCPRCGGGGGDHPSPGSADAEARDTVGNGYPLKYVDGELMCEMCEKEYRADNESIRAAERHQDEKVFRAGAGFTNSI